MKDKLKKLIEEFYPELELKKVENIIDKYKTNKINYKITHKTNFVISYADSITNSFKKIKLEKFLKKNYSNINNIHLLPFFSYTSDDGFSVSDYYNVDKRFLNWKNIKNLNSFNLMYDFVANHSSKSNKLFDNFLNDKTGYEDLYTEYDDNFDYSKVVRPRTSPLFHEYKNDLGKIKKVWSTFSEDQVDLNYRSEKTILHILDILGFYLYRGARLIRLDAIGFIWKESGTSCMSLDKTHKLVQLISLFGKEIDKDSIIITETNVPHKENISYLTKDEADLVYNFTLPPLLLHTIFSEDSSVFNNWIEFYNTDLPDDKTMFNFLSSHDGIGMRGVQNILTSKQIDSLILKLENNGAKINYKSNPDGTKSPYEACTTFYSAIKDSDLNIWNKRYLLLHSILLAIKGVPAIYINSLLLAENDLKGYELTKQNRSLNRKKFNYSEIKKISNQENFLKFSSKINNLMSIKSSYNAFDPYSKIEKIELGKETISFIRKGTTNVIVVNNITPNKIEKNLNGEYKDLITNRFFKSKLILEPYEFLWLIQNKK